MKYRFLITLILLASFNMLFGASILYSGHPVGEMFLPVSVQSKGMASVCVAIPNSRSLSLVNPANLAVLKTAVFSVTNTQEYLILKDDKDNKTTLQNGDIPLVVFACPIGFLGSFHIAYTQIAKNDFKYSTGKYLPNSIADSVSQTFGGTGSRYAGQVGFSRAWSSWFYTGIYYQHFLGNIGNTRSIEYDSTEVYYAPEHDTTFLYANGDKVGFGITVPYKTLMFGFSVNYTISSDITKKKSVSIVPNTKVEISRTKEEILEETMPIELAFGIGMKVSKQLDASMDVAYGLWSEYKRTDYNKELDNGISVALGFEWTKNRYSEYSYINQIPLRTGCFYKKLPNDSIKELGVTLGIGLPTKNNTGIFDVAFEYSKKGSIEETKLTENSFKVSLGFTGNGKWGQSKRRRH